MSYIIQINIVGGFIIVMTGFLIGNHFSNEIQKRQKLLTDMYEMFLLIENELRYKRVILSEVFGNVSVKIESPYKEFLQTISFDLQDNLDVGKDKIWSVSVKKCINKADYPENIYLMFERFGEKLGYLDIESQLSNIDLFLNELKKEIDENRERINEKCRLYKSMGIIFGIMLFIVIM